MKIYLTAEDRANRYAYLRSKNQALFRGEIWQITYDEYLGIWRNKHHKRGRGRDRLSMCRIDLDGAWHVSNVVLLTRTEYNKKNNQYNQEKKARKRRQKWKAY